MIKESFNNVVWKHGRKKEWYHNATKPIRIAYKNAQEVVWLVEEMSASFPMEKRATQKNNKCFLIVEFMNKIKKYHKEETGKKWAMGFGGK